MWKSESVAAISKVQSVVESDHTIAILEWPDRVEGTANEKCVFFQSSDSTVVN